MVLGRSGCCWIRGSIGAVTVFVLACHPARAQDVIPELLVFARQLSPSINEPVYATTLVDRESLAQSGEARLDDVLRSVPGFGLFRRQSSRASHPTTQGVTLRGLGPSGAGRTLVLLDGVPQNDPFGGWVDWSRLPSASLESVLITRGGGAGPWGNAALAGVIRLRSRTDTGNHGWAEVRGDSAASVDGTAAAQIELGTAHIFGTAHGHRSDGVFLIRKDRRGPVDVRTANRGGWFQGGTLFGLGDDIEVSATGNYSKDRYVNGIGLAVSETRNADGAVSLVREGGPDDIAWEAHFYMRDGKASSIFSSVNAARTAAAPSLAQFNVPSQALGANAVVRVPVAPSATIEVGLDVRAVEGSTNEHFTYIANAFTRLRHAGGAQLVAGGFVEGNWQPAPAITLTAGGRLDHWKQSDGVRSESVVPTGVVVRDDVYPERDGTVGNFRVGVRGDVASTLTVRALAYSGFRIPTLNELYRPFRVGNDITEANPALDPERLRGIEAGVEWSALPTLKLSGTIFRNWLSNAVGNITVTTTPGLEPTLGVVVPAGGVLRQRRNVDKIVANGFEGEALWSASDRLDVSLRYLLSAPKITRSVAQPGLEGLKLAQVARHQFVLGGIFRPDAYWTLKGELRTSSSQFDDDQNTRLLKGYATVDLYVDRALTDNASLFFGVENLLDAEIQAGRSADGVVTVGAPRTVSGGLRVRF